MHARRLPVSLPAATRLRRLAVSAFAALLLAACGDGTGPGESTPASVAVSPGEARLTAIGETTTLTATARDADGTTVVGTAFSWSVDDEGVATIASDGTVTAIGNGTATVTARVSGSSPAVPGTARVVVAQAAASIALSPAADSLLLGETLPLTADVRDARGNPVPDAPLTWTTSDEAVAVVDANGVVTGVDKGLGTITATSGDAAGESELTVFRASLSAAADTALSGTLRVEDFNVPAGVTVTAAGDLTVDAAGAVTLDGTLTGECVAIELRAGADVTFTEAVVENDCAEPPPVDTASFRVLALGAITVDSAVITAAGDVFFSNDPADFDATAAGQASRAAAAAAAAATDCTYRRETITRPAAETPSSDPNKDVRKGAGIDKTCAGTMTVEWSNFAAGDGQPGAEAGSTTDEPAVGAAGGNGGSIFLAASGGLRFVGDNWLIGGQGGIGGAAGAESTGTRSEARGGAGGDAGIVSLTAPDIYIDGRLNLKFFNGGAGGGAIAIGPDGEPGEPGGEAIAFGGDAGDLGLEPRTPLIGDLIAHTLHDPDKLEVHLGTSTDPFLRRSGLGGVAVAAGGDGGEGTGAQRDGREGGDITAVGGEGASSFLYDDRMSRFIGLPGSGGPATFARGGGGDGYDGCQDDPWTDGGNGGAGANGVGSNGYAGFLGTERGTNDRSWAGVLLSRAGNGGNGGDGVNAGTKGVGGDGTLITPRDADIEVHATPNFSPGADGNACQKDYAVNFQDRETVNNVPYFGLEDALTGTRTGRIQGDLALAQANGREVTIRPQGFAWIGLDDATVDGQPLMRPHTVVVENLGPGTVRVYWDKPNGDHGYSDLAPGQTEEFDDMAVVNANNLGDTDATITMTIRQ